MSGSEEYFEFHMVLEFVGIPKDISHADWIQLHQSRRKRISPTTYELQHPSGGESDLKSSSGHASTTSSKIGAVTNIGDRIEKLSVHQKMPEGDRQKSHGPDQRSAKDDLLLVEKRIDHYGGELRNETFGISLSIPPGALVEGTSEIITLTILTEKPEDLKLRDDEMIVSYGFRCSPPGLKFLAPVRLTIPHCAVLTDPAKVETVLYLSDENGKPVNIGRRIAVVFDDGQSQESGYRRITSSGKASSFQGGMPGQETTSESFNVLGDRFEVFLTHFSRGFMAIVWDWLYVQGTQLLCMPYLPRKMPTDRCPVLDVCFYKNNRGVKESEQYKQHESDRKIAQLTVGHEFQLSGETEDLLVTCGINGEEEMKEKLNKRELASIGTEMAVYFTVNFQNKPDDSRIRVTLDGKRNVLFNAEFGIVSTPPSNTGNTNPKPTAALPSADSGAAVSPATLWYNVVSSVIENNKALQNLKSYMCRGVLSEEF
ncbi:uncharacterized protein [Diadema antillarum]|uniref:uncharacterized protein n=1 Tax=Diadema antillarum TaxID=105358 RepID=UPI003A8AF717